MQIYRLNNSEPIGVNMFKTYHFDPENTLIFKFIQLINILYVGKNKPFSKEKYNSRQLNGL